MNLTASEVLFPTGMRRQVGAASSKVSTCASKLWGRHSLLGLLRFPYSDRGNPVQFRSLLTKHFFSVTCVPSIACL